MKEEIVSAGSSIEIGELVITQVRHSAMEATVVENHCIVKFSLCVRRDFIEGEVEEGPGLRQFPVRWHGFSLEGCGPGLPCGPLFLHPATISFDPASKSSTVDWIVHDFYQRNSPMRVQFQII